MPFLNFSLLINEIELINYSPMKHSVLEGVGRITLQNWIMHLAQASSALKEGQVTRGMVRDYRNATKTEITKRSRS